LCPFHTKRARALNFLEVRRVRTRVGSGIVRYPAAGKAALLAAMLWLLGDVAVRASELAVTDRADASQQDRRMLRGWSVFWSFLVWPAGSTVSVCFFDRDAELRGVFAEAASDWTRIANIRFDFGQPPGYRTCDAVEPSDIRVKFRAGSGLSIAAGSSSVGTLGLDLAPSKPTLHIGLAPLPGKPRRPFADMRPIILHEMGHALGLPHEHQHPQSPCVAEYRWKDLCTARQARVAQDATLMEAHKYASQLRAQMLPRSDPIDAGLPPYDADSIMHYRFPARLLTNGQKSACLSRAPRTLSAGDAARMAILYPKDAAEQARFLRAQAEIFRQTLARSGLSRRTAARLADYAENQLGRRHAELGIKIDLADLNLPETDTSALEKTLAQGGGIVLPPECAARPPTLEKDAAQ
jgi:hypothetical protein